MHRDAERRSIIWCRAEVGALTVYSSLLRPLLFRMSADRAHDLGKAALRWPAPWRFLAGGGSPDPRLATDFGGLALTSPIGLAPGFDKRGDLVPALVELGFGFVVVGSITAAPRAGNPKPRLHRDVARRSLTNCMGMPNPGVDEAVRLLARPRRSGPKVLAAIAGTSVEEAVRLAATVEPHVDAVEVGLVCRHSPETFEMAELPTVTAILEAVGRQKTKPTFVKIPPHHTPAERQRTLAIVDACIANGIEGVSLSGTQQVPDPNLSMGVGGLAGKATTDDALRILGDVAERAAGRLAIKAAGGIFDGADAARFLEAGATAVELYSAFVYRGPRVARQIGRELAAIVDARGLASVADLRRSPLPSPTTADGVAVSA
jgi:dihydroorotate dehydrogenase